MIVVCRCGVKSRIRDLATASRMRCATCKEMLGPEIHRQAARNANIVLEVAAVLADRIDKRIVGTPEGEELIAQIIARHEVTR